MGKLYYEIAGDGPPVVLVHSTIADSRMWEEQVEAFARSHRVVRYDLAGYGRSPLPLERFAHVEDLRALLDELAIDRAALVGLSGGASIALSFALLHPDRVSALVLASAGLPEHDWSEAMERVHAEEEAALERGDAEAATEVNMRAWIDGPFRGTNGVDPEIRGRMRVMCRRGLEVYLEAVSAGSVPEWPQPWTHR